MALMQDSHMAKTFSSPADAKNLMSQNVNMSWQSRWAKRFPPLRQTQEKAMVNWTKALTELPQAYADANTMRTSSERPNVTSKPQPEPREQPEPRVRSSYLGSVYEPERFQKTVQAVVEALRPHVDDFDAIVFRGSSGAALGYTLGYLLKKPIVHVRKGTEGSHSWDKVEGYYGAKRIAVVDDFVASGDTIRITLDDLAEAYKKRGYERPVFAHLFLYAARYSDIPESVAAKVGPDALDTHVHLNFDIC
jgi:hypothetical protein